MKNTGNDELDRKIGKFVRSALFVAGIGVGLVIIANLYQTMTEEKDEVICETDNIDKVVINFVQAENEAV